MLRYGASRRKSSPGHSGPLLAAAISTAALGGLHCSLIYPASDLSDETASDGGVRPADASAFVPIRIVCGSDAAVYDEDGNVWGSDHFYEGGQTFCNFPGQYVEAGSPQLYHCERFSDASFLYEFPTVPPGNYKVLLKFTENAVMGPGERLFNVTINDALALRDLDIFKSCGDKSFVPYDTTLPVAILGSGGLRVVFTAVVYNAKVDAIEITSSSD